MLLVVKPLWFRRGTQRSEINEVLSVLSVRQKKREKNIIAVTLLKNNDNAYSVSQLIRGLRLNDADIISDVGHRC